MNNRVLSFVMAGCPACHEFAPRLGRIAAPYRARGLPVHVVDIGKPMPPALQALAKTIKATPTTVILKGGYETSRKVGAVADAEIAKLLATATR